ncbi:MAG: transporter substrate-binding protein [Dehalococcoidia bacterium]|nr:transporter substrate-binding protein [Dehalococcoidia bacterium]
MKRLSRYAVILGLVSLLIFACAAPSKPAPSPVPETPLAERPAARGPELSGQQQVIERAKQEGKVVIWSNTFEGAEQFKREFGARYPFLEFTKWDAPTGRDMVARLAEEAKIGKLSADVVATSVTDFPELLRLGLIKEYAWPNTKGWPYQPNNGFYRVTTAGLRIPIYNTQLVAAAEVPRSWDDLKNTRWRGKSQISRSGPDAPLIFAYMWREGDKLNWEKAEAFWREVVKNNRPSVGRGFQIPTELLAAGESSILLLGSTLTTLSLMSRGAPLGIAPVERAMAPPFALAIVKDGPHPNAATLLADYLTSSEGLLLYANANLMNVIDPAVDKKSRAGGLLGSLGIQWEPPPTEIYTEENVKRSSDLWLAIVEGR